MADYDLAIRGGTLVGPKGRRAADVYVEGGLIAALGTEKHAAREEVDATGLLVLPGMVDAHVHFMDPADTTREDFPSATAAAARAGVTTVVEHAHGKPVVSADDLEEKAAYLADRSRIDYALAAHALPEKLAETPGVWDAGAAFLKAFTCTTHGIPGFSPAELQELFAIAAENDAICLVHCEDESLTEAAGERLRKAHRTDGGLLPDWRNREAEVVSVSYTSLLARYTNARVVIAHVSHVDALDAVARARAEGADIYAETCPQYLHLYEDEVLEHGALRKFTPPARARSAADLEAMWSAVRDGRVDLLSSDHAPSTRAQKADGDLWDVHFGVPGIDTTFPLLLNAAASGHVSYERIVELYAANPAALYGLAPRKGSLEPGADADVVLVDPDRQWVISAERVRSKAGWSPYEGMQIAGDVVRTYCRGRLVADDAGFFAEPGSGKFIPARQEQGDRRARSND
jgi:allantoinase